MHDFLSTILQEKKSSLEKQKKRAPEAELKARVQTPHTERLFKDALSNQEKVSLIAEIKHSSPSKGIIREDFNPTALATMYEQSGASSLSVLTETRFFGGDITHIEEIVKSVKLPILRKDFIIDAYQIYESFVAGARAILLISSILSQEQLEQFIAIAHSLGIDCLVEIHSEEDLKKALSSHAEIIGINNRNLQTFNVDIKTSGKLIPLIPKDKIIVSESGIVTRDDVARLESLGVNAVLIGETLLRSQAIESKIKELMAW
ncbi:indole-3-glycerol phosphate synthase TrpC [Candidatus Omnitrophota bacterium]